MSKPNKIKSARQEVREQRIKAAMPKVRLAVEKAIAGLALVALAMRGTYSFLEQYVKVSNVVLSVISLVIVAGLALKLAQCDTK